MPGSGCSGNADMLEKLEVFADGKLVAVSWIEGGKRFRGCVQCKVKEAAADQ